jgi:hypothetical protein
VASERLVEALRDPRIASDVRVSGDFVRLYCKGNHEDRDREPLASAGVEVGCYRRVPVLCGECAELQEYAEKRRAFCPFDPKPYCSECETHCYKPDRREHMREVMRYAGPRSFGTHPIEGVKHAMAMRRSRTKLRQAGEEG